MKNKKEFKDLTTKEKIGGFLVLGVIILVLFAIFSPSDSNNKDSGSQAQSEATPTETPAQHDLQAEVRFSDNAYQITNKEDVDWTDCKLEMNAGLVRGGYIYKASLIKAQEPLVISFREFAKSDGTRFNSYDTKPQSLSISCEVGDQHGFGYYGTE